MNIGSRINKRLSEIGLTQAALAKRLKTSESTVSHWMTGKFNPGSRYLKKIEEELRTTTSYLNGETDNPNAIGAASQLSLDLQPEAMPPVSQPPSGAQGVQSGPQVFPLAGEQPKDRVADYSLKMGAWGVSVERRMSGGVEIKLEAPRGAEQKIKALMDAVWEIIVEGYVVGTTEPEAPSLRGQARSVRFPVTGTGAQQNTRKRTEAHLLVEQLGEEQLDRLNEWLRDPA